MMGYGGWGGFGLSWVSMLLFWALFVLGVAALIRYIIRSGDSKDGKTPLDILKQRYAGGEIEKKEFEEKKKDLS
ncbi:SHOCT domain-containing protein [Candidatus Collierbacteria bacterium]|nr:SHOCT domain-containing protein [Candidatus Collierbacteria bacterium]